MNRLYLIIPFLLITLLASDCNGRSSGEQSEQRAVNQNVNQRQSEIGQADIVNFQEYKFAVMIQEMRDKALATHTYYITRKDGIQKLCTSVGYGLPYSTQTTNPMKTVHEANGGDHAIPQAEPNTLYMPENVDATWVMCNTEDGDNQPIYSEPQLIVSPVPLDELAK